MPSITYIWTTFVKVAFSKSIIFKVKNTFEPNVFKWVIKIIFISSSHFALLIINVKILFNFQKKGSTFGRKKDVWKCSLSMFECFEHAFKHFWSVSSFGHVNFAINGKISKNIYEKIQTIMFPLWSFKLNIQKCSFKECPFTWVAPLIMILPFWLVLMQFA